MKKFPIRLYIGIFLVIISWVLNWSLDGLRTQFLFFPLWVGYAIVVDGLVFYRKGTSIISRSLPAFIGLFIISIPSWWLFEFLNQFTQNWIYVGRQYFTDLEFTIYASLNFSTVMPVVFGTAELFSTFKWMKKPKFKTAVKLSNKNLLRFLFLGILMLLLLIIFPKYFYYFMWASVFFILEPINYRLKNRTIFDYVSTGNWTPVLSLWFGALTCGFFWEFWNYFSYPKWIYDIPFLNFAHIFEMPLPGYMGYIPFSLELFAIFSFISGLIGTKKFQNIIQL